MKTAEMLGLVLGCFLFLPGGVSSVSAMASPTDIAANDAETDGGNGFTALAGASEAAIFTDTTFGSTHAIVTGFFDNGVQIVTLDGTVPVELLYFRVR